MPEGTLRDDHIAAYQQFGDYLQSCYGTPIDATYGSKVVTLTLSLPSSVAINQFVLQEDQSGGQRVLAFTISVMQTGSWQQVYSGNSIGNKHIALLSRTFTTTQAQLQITQQTAPVTIRNFAAYFCDSPTTWKSKRV
eukprot:TRINITY_DN11805_c0_g1_i2.p1 TRINITY_DN11805_c0_g1~~TRINITY_DN11805_c0_g1_i2.p1  ORF type:complete len:137 (+),score=11.39 TRINITY_DN11805_c0_g1_i2:128-538(+)